MANDLYLRGAFEMSSIATAPGPATAISTLLRLSFQMQDLPFQYCFVDKPRSGTSAVVYHDPSRPYWPSDGIRYLSQSEDGPGESFSVSTHSLPNNVNAELELETAVVTGGIFPPSNPAIPLSKDSPDLQLARYRIRWRIKTPNLGNPALWLVYWGRDERAAQRAPAGWEREVIRDYPLPTLPPDNPAQQPLRTRRALPPPPLVEPAYRPTSASPAPHTPFQHRHPSASMSQPPQPPYPQHQHQPSLPPNVMQPPPNHSMYQQGRQQSMSVGPAPGSSHGVPQQQQHMQQQNMQPLQQQAQAPQQQQQRRNTTKQSQSILNRKALPQSGSGKPHSGSTQQQQHTSQAISASTQPQVHALQAIPPHLRAAVVASAAHSSFPQGFSDPYDYLSSRSWAGLRYERNHTVIAPIFDPSTTTEIMESWIEPSFPDLEKIKEEISLLKKEVEDLKACQSQLPGKSLFGVSSNANNEASTSTSQQLVRRPSAVNGASPSARKDGTRQKELDALLAPLPRMIPIAEMHDKAMQAYNARRKEVEDALQAQRHAKEEEERIAREKVEAELAAKRAVQEEARETERRERQAKMEEEQGEERKRRRQKEEEMGTAIASKQQANASNPDIKMEDTSSTQPPPRPQQQESQTGPVQAGQGGATANGHNSAQGEEMIGTENANGTGEAGASGPETYFDDSYSLLMDNYNMYENNGTGFTMPGDDMMDDSLFSEYMDQMGSM